MTLYLGKVLIKFYLVTLLDQIPRLNIVPVSFFQDDNQQLLCLNRRLLAIILGFEPKHKIRSMNKIPLIQPFMPAAPLVRKLWGGWTLKASSVNAW